jgi:hypothetical protein
MTHLTSDELIDAMDGVLAQERQAHASECGACRRQLDELAAVVKHTRDVDVPEPSPLFWQHLSANVNAAIDRQMDHAGPRWLRWQILLPLGAVAMLVAALVFSLPDIRRAPAPPAGHVAIGDRQPEPDQWGTVAELVGEFDLDAAAETGVLEPGLAEEAVLQLTAEERAELTRLLQAELSRAKS